MVEVSSKLKPLGDILLEQKLITHEQLQLAIEEQKRTGERLGQILIRRGYVSPKIMGKILESQVGIPYVHLADYNIDSEVVKLIPENLIRRFKALPLKRENNNLYVAMIHPINLNAVDELKLITGCRITPLITTDKELTEAINRQFDIKEKATQAIEEFRKDRGQTLPSPEVYVETVDGDEMVEEVPVVRLVNSIIIGGINAETSDIHLEPQFPEMRVRYRVDGMLHDAMTIPPYIQRAVISRVKIMAGMNIAERRIPQDGQISFTYEKRGYDLRVSTLPTRLGEKVVIRVLDQEKLIIGLALLGMLPDELEIFQQLISIPWGMILVAGPTGSGKTTTLYAVLNQINTPAKNIVTVEDPVEFHLRGINQIQVNPKAGVTFATGLRAILRQDPNIIMVGEIRDEETARISVHAALTGHLVLSTIHTTDAPSVVIRLLEMKVEPYLVASTVIGVVAQRLVRIICSSCKQEYKPKEEELAQLKIPEEKLKKFKFYKGKGCKQCNFTGYKGRTGVFEVMKMDRELRELITKRSPAAIIREVAIKNGMRPLYDSGLEKINQGITTIEEITRVTYKEE